MLVKAMLKLIMLIDTDYFVRIVLVFIVYPRFIKWSV